MAQGTTIQTSTPEDADLPQDLETETGTELNGAADPTIEARAREMGWKPLAEYRGPPGKWQPAAEFIARGENILPIVRDQNRRMTERISKLEGEVTGLRTTATEQLQIIKDLREMGRRASDAGYERAMAEIKAQQRRAVEAGDTQAFDQLVERAEALESERAPAQPAARTTTDTPSVPPAPKLSGPTQAFIAQNPWFATNKLLADTMIAFHQEILNERQVDQAVLNADPELDRDLLEQAKARVVEKYPERFGVAPQNNPPPRQTRRAATVAQPTPEPPARPPGGALTTINAIADPTERAEARTAFNRMKRQMTDFTEAEYMALYADPHGDILSMQQQKARRQQ